jgi:hypothetical protein
MRMPPDAECRLANPTLAPCERRAEWTGLTDERDMFQFLSWQGSSQRSCSFRLRHSQFRQQIDVSRVNVRGFEARRTLLLIALLAVGLVASTGPDFLENLPPRNYTVAACLE